MREIPGILLNMRPQLFTYRIDLCLTERQRQRLEHEAEKQDMTMNEIMRELINEHL